MFKIVFLFGLMLVASCTSLNHSYRLKLVKTNPVSTTDVVQHEKKKEIIVLQKTEVEAQNSISEIALASATQSSPSIENSDLNIETELRLEKNVKAPFFEIDETKNVQEEDSLQIIASALETERIAKKSMISGIISVAFYLFPYLGIASLIFGIIGLAKAKTAQKREYSTPKGIKYARAGKVLSIIGIVLGSLFALLLLALLILFFIFL